MTKPRIGLSLALAMTFVSRLAAQMPEPPAPRASTSASNCGTRHHGVEKPATVLKEFPKEIVIGDIRLYDFQFEPAPGASCSHRARVWR